MARLFTKSAFTTALECPRRLCYLNNSGYANQDLNDEFLMQLAEGGFQVGELAKVYYGIRGKYSIGTLDEEEALECTATLLQEQNANIAEAAFRSGNLEVIQDVATRMRRYHDVYKIPEAVADRTARFCLAHVAWLNQDRETARKMYHVLWPEAETVGWREFLWPDFVFPLFFRDMAQISVLEGKPDEAVEFLDRELQVRTPDDYQYFLAESMKAQIRKDLPGQLKAWEKIVEMQPENRVYRMIYDELVQNSGNAPK